MRLYLLFFLSPLLLAASATAQDSGAPLQPGMRQMTITQPPPPPDKKAAEPDTAAPAPEAPALKKERPILKIDDALTKYEELRPWPHLPDLLTSSDKNSLTGVLKEIENNPELVPPRALFYAASALAQRGDMEQAALYYYAAQLRARFDAQRFPDDDKASPHRAIGHLSLEVGTLISPWAMENAQRLKGVMVRVKDWDQRTAYSYDPGYTPKVQISFEEWPKLLEKERELYFAQTQKLLGALQKVQENRP